MEINEMIFEVTRQCNLACRHCMRGDPQNVVMSDETISKALEGVTGIYTITFTGGEPSLAVDRIQAIIKELKRRRISVYGFYVVTNGKVASKKLMYALIELYDYCEDNETSSLTISKDQYHHELLGEAKKADNLYRALSFYNPDERKHNIDTVINEGHAEAEGIGTRNIQLDSLLLSMTDDDRIDRVENNVYINALGDVLPSCDLSFASQEEEKIGNVHKNTLAEILLREYEKDKIESE
jgi:molybdenum cofactor biosynthesis enzyme MoaA